MCAPDHAELIAFAAPSLLHANAYAVAAAALLHCHRHLDRHVH